MARWGEEDAEQQRGVSGLAAFEMRAFEHLKSRPQNDDSIQWAFQLAKSTSPLVSPRAKWPKSVCYGVEPRTRNAFATRPYIAAWRLDLLPTFYDIWWEKKLAQINSEWNKFGIADRATKKLI